MYMFLEYKLIIRLKGLLNLLTISYLCKSGSRKTFRVGTTLNFTVMKKIVLILSAAFLMAACNTGTNDVVEPTPAQTTEAGVNAAAVADPEIVIPGTPVGVALSRGVRYDLQLRNVIGTNFTWDVYPQPFIFGSDPSRPNTYGFMTTVAGQYTVSVYSPLQPYVTIAQRTLTVY